VVQWNDIGEAENHAKQNIDEKKPSYEQSESEVGFLPLPGAQRQLYSAALPIQPSRDSHSTGGRGGGLGLRRRSRAGRDRGIQRRHLPLQPARRARPGGKLRSGGARGALGILGQRRPLGACAPQRSCPHAASDPPRACGQP
jgi:hypothetical protein